MREKKKFASSTMVLLVMVRELVYYFLIELDAHASVNLHKSIPKPKNRSCWTKNQIKPRPNNNRSCYLNKKKIEAPLATRIQQCGVGTPLLKLGKDMGKLIYQVLFVRRWNNSYLNSCWWFVSTWHKGAGLFVHIASGLFWFSLTWIKKCCSKALRQAKQSKAKQIQVYGTIK
jgi:hypothetical protein